MIDHTAHYKHQSAAPACWLASRTPQVCSVVPSTAWHAGPSRPCRDRCASGRARTPRAAVSSVTAAKRSSRSSLQPVHGIGLARARDRWVRQQLLANPVVARTQCLANSLRALRHLQAQRLIHRLDSHRHHTEAATADLRDGERLEATSARDRAFVGQSREVQRCTPVETGSPQTRWPYERSGC